MIDSRMPASTTELKRLEQALEEQRNVVSAIFDTAAALLVVLDPQGRIIRFNRACEQTTGYTFDEVSGKRIRDIFMIPDEIDRFISILEQLRNGVLPTDYETYWLTKSGERQLISWSGTVLTANGDDGGVTHIIMSGIDVTERKRLERAVLQISTREQHRIGQDLHDGLGQHLTGIAFLGKVLQDRLAEGSRVEASEAARIVGMVNDSIKMTRDLARGLLPVVAEARGLMSALGRRAGEVSDMFHIACRFVCPYPVLIQDGALADHLYHLTQEAVNNAIKHGKSSAIVIGLTSTNDRGVLTIQDDGAGFLPASSTPSGLGLRIMHYRAIMIGGSLEVESRPGAGTLVRCLFPLVSQESEDRDAG